MSNAYVLPYRECLDFSLSLYEKFLSICPDEIWQKKFGRWHVSQQYYHALGATGLFLSSFAQQEIDNPRPEAGNLVPDNEIQPTKEEANRLLKSVWVAISKLGSSMDDTTLLQVNDKASAALGRQVNNARVLGLMDGHLLYHLGSCDAALRENGIDGAF